MGNRKFQFASRGPQKGWFEGGWLKLQEIQDFWPTLEIENNREKMTLEKKKKDFDHQFDLQISCNFSFLFFFFFERPHKFFN